MWAIISVLSSSFHLKWNGTSCTKDIHGYNQLFFPLSLCVQRLIVKSLRVSGYYHATIFEPMQLLDFFFSLEACDLKITNEERILGQKGQIIKLPPPVLANTKAVQPPGRPVWRRAPWALGYARRQGWGSVLMEWLQSTAWLAGWGLL